MTAEIAILNREGVALAADSAVTLGGDTGGRPKIFTSANKIHALSLHEPVGIMVYGAADLMRVPWETIIKTYRAELGRTAFPHLRQQTEHFLAWLAADRRLFPNEIQEGFVGGSVISYLGGVLAEIKGEVESQIHDAGEVTRANVQNTVREVIGRHHSQWSAAPVLPSAPPNHAAALRRRYGKVIDATIQEVFENLPLADRQRSQLRELAIMLLTRRPEDLTFSATSGVVIAGFGRDDVFPCLEHIETDGIAGDVLKHFQVGRSEITHEDVAVVAPFAQQEMVHEFMRGLSPVYQLAFNEVLEDLLQKYPERVLDGVAGVPATVKRDVAKKVEDVAPKMMAAAREHFENLTRAQFVDPVIDVVASLPKDELAAMAEALVNLTSFKRRISMADETVGGPIDVAVISKGDGFIWIRRKQYFDPALNARYFDRQQA